MKEMPGAPALPEGWFYRVVAKPKGGNPSRGYKWEVWVRRKCIVGSLSWGYGVVWRDHISSTFYGDDEPTVEQLASAATFAYNKTFPKRKTMTGDYR